MTLGCADRSSGAFRAWPQYLQLAAAAMVMTIAETIAFEGLLFHSQSALPMPPVQLHPP